MSVTPKSVIEKCLREVRALDRYKFTLIWFLAVGVLAILAWQEPKLAAGIALGAIAGRLPATKSAS